MQRRLQDAAETFFRKLSSAFVTPVDQGIVCLQCIQVLGGQYLYADTKEGYRLIFCSERCSYAYWEECGRYGKIPPMAQGPRICRLPGCNKPCFVEGSKVHDYCGRTHAKEHGAMSSPKTQGGRWTTTGKSTGNGRQNSGGTGFFSGRGNRTGPVLFYNRGEPYYEFTNFFEAVVNIDDEDWLTTEHYFQAQKFVGTPLVSTIRMLERPRDAFEKSRDPKYAHWRRSDWESVKEDIMFKALQAKFTQHEDLKKLLVGTKDRRLVEHSPHDKYWGDGGDGSGENRLGILLMKLRDELTRKSAAQDPIQRSPPSPPAHVHDHTQKDAPVHPTQEKNQGWSMPHFSPERDTEKPRDQTDPPSTTVNSAPQFTSQRCTPSLSYSSVVAGGTSSTTGGATPAANTQFVLVQPLQPHPQPNLPNEGHLHHTVSNQACYPPPTVANQQFAVSCHPNPQSVAFNQGYPQPTVPNQPLVVQGQGYPQTTVPNQTQVWQTAQNQQLPTSSSQLAPQPPTPAIQQTLPPNTSIATTTEAPQQLAFTVTNGNLLGEYNITTTSGQVLTRPPLSSSHGTTPPSSGAPAETQDELPTPMDTSN